MTETKKILESVLEALRNEHADNDGDSAVQCGIEIAAEQVERAVRALCNPPRRYIDFSRDFDSDLDKDGYPSQKALIKIKEADITDPSKRMDLINYIGRLWKWADQGFFRSRSDKDSWELELHTGGWSGNEDIITALKGNPMFWLMYWSKSEKGGHYYFVGSNK